MLNKIKSILKSKSGNAMVYCLMFSGFILLLGFAVMVFQQNIATIAYVRDTSRQVFDVYTSSAAKKVMNSIKSGNDYIVDINDRQYKKLLKEALDLDNDEFVGHNEGLRRFTISNIKTSYVFDKTLKTKVEYTLDVPFCFGKVEIIRFNKKVVVECRYNLKYY